MNETRSLAQAKRFERDRPIPSVPDYDCGIEGHLFTILTDLDKVPRYAKCSACKKEWAFAMVMEVRRIEP